jgi:hypothetical protein
MTGSLSVPGWSTRDCQSGFAPDVEILWNPSPNTPERDPDSKWSQILYVIAELSGNLPNTWL